MVWLLESLRLLINLPTNKNGNLALFIVIWLFILMTMCACLDSYRLVQQLTFPFPVALFDKCTLRKLRFKPK